MLLSCVRLHIVNLAEKLPAALTHFLRLFDLHVEIFLSAYAVSMVMKCCSRTAVFNE